MRPARAAPVVPFVTLPLHWNPNACASDHCGFSDPVVPFKPPCLTQTKPGSGATVASGGHYFQVAFISSRLQPWGAASRPGSFPNRLRPVRWVPSQPVPPRRPTPRTTRQSEKQRNESAQCDTAEHHRPLRRCQPKQPAFADYVSHHCMYLVLTFHTLASVGGKSCSAPVTDQFNVAPAGSASGIPILAGCRQFHGVKQEPNKSQTRAMSRRLFLA